MYCLTELSVSLWYVMCIQVCGAITSALNEARLQIAMSDRRQSFVSHRVSLHTQKYIDCHSRILAVLKIAACLRLS